MIHINDAYTWCAFYRDGRSLPEFDEVDTFGRGFADVDSARVEAMELSPLREGVTTTHRVLIPEGATPVFFRRRRIEFAVDGGEANRSTTHCIGWKRGDEEGVYLFVGDDGSTLLTNEFQAI